MKYIKTFNEAKVSDNIDYKIPYYIVIYRNDKFIKAKCMIKKDLNSGYRFYVGKDYIFRLFGTYKEQLATLTSAVIIKCDSMVEDKAIVLIAKSEESLANEFDNFIKFINNKITEDTDIVKGEIQVLKDFYQKLVDSKEDLKSVKCANLPYFKW